MAKFIWITGASSGIGRALALSLAKAGHGVAVTARSAEALGGLAAEHQNIHPYPGDVTDAAAMKAVWQRICDAHGVPQLVVLNAGTHQPTSAAAFAAADHERLMQVNYQGVVNGLAAVLPALMTAGRGHVAVVASVAGYGGLPYAGAYCASKAAVIALCQSLYPELAAHGVKLQLINPGFVKTPLTDQNDFPMPFLMEVADAVARIERGLVSSRFEITFPRRLSVVLKFLHLLPYPLYFAVTRRMLRS